MNVVDSIEHFCVEMLDFPEYIPQEAQDLICRMLDCDPTSRITASEILVRVGYLFLDRNTRTLLELISRVCQIRSLLTFPPSLLYLLFTMMYGLMKGTHDQELENELNVLRGSFDAAYKESLNKKQEGMYALFAIISYFETSR